MVYLVVFGGFTCLFPLAFYCLLLASWNNRRRPFFVNGPADFAGVLVATSGFLIVGGPLILYRLHAAAEGSVAHPSFTAAWFALGRIGWVWLLAWCGYFVAVVGGAVWLLIRRRSVSVVYNIDPAEAGQLVPTLLNRLDVEWVQRGREFWIERPQEEAFDGVVLDVTIRPKMRHMALDWSSNAGGVRQRFEADLKAALAEIASPHNPFSSWLVTAATAIFTLLLVLLGLLLHWLWRLRH
jgi:hypothetical protein